MALYASFYTPNVLLHLDNGKVNPVYDWYGFLQFGVWTTIIVWRCFMQEKLFDSELKVMEIIWEKGSISAKEISLIAADSIGWNKNTTYTVIKKLEAKGFIRRDEPGFICTPLVSKEEIQKREASSLLDKVFGGSRKALFSALLEDEKLSDKEIKELKDLIDKR